MLTVILSILAYGHDSLMLLIYYSRTLGRRYSLKITAAATGVWWVMQCACKLPVMYFADEYSMSVVMMLQCLLMGGYLFLCYGHSGAGGNHGHIDRGKYCGSRQQSTRSRLRVYCGGNIAGASAGGSGLLSCVFDLENSRARKLAEGWKAMALRAAASEPAFSFMVFYRSIH